VLFVCLLLLNKSPCHVYLCACACRAVLFLLFMRDLYLSLGHNCGERSAFHEEVNGDIERYPLYPCTPIPHTPICLFFNNHCLVYSIYVFWCDLCLLLIFISIVLDGGRGEHPCRALPEEAPGGPPATIARGQIK
jgi:hypothetical protein